MNKIIQIYQFSNGYIIETPDCEGRPLHRGWLIDWSDDKKVKKQAVELLEELAEQLEISEYIEIKEREE